MASPLAVTSSTTEFQLLKPEIQPAGALSNLDSYRYAHRTFEKVAPGGYKIRVYEYLDQDFYRNRNASDVDNAPIEVPVPEIDRQPPFPNPIVKCGRAISSRYPIISPNDYDLVLKKGFLYEMFTPGVFVPRRGLHIVGVEGWDIILWFCNYSLRYLKTPTPWEYLNVDGHLEGVCGSRIVGFIKVPAFEWGYGRRTSNTVGTPLTYEGYCNT
ncbi:hypothetical protein BJ508DRAFT_308385 [Ascobolus immersus RN42]|uniref:Uncharacterized protein n=1 Tax=Ascobolus immersus RN42 TaxID=1160509 RepID=A0A3N4I449_ASCIM|nr:hypothetical protein BJ508DRAFT_308385 [Ascobolus immersus RN42]